MVRFYVRNTGNMLLCFRSAGVSTGEGDTGDFRLDRGGLSNTPEPGDEDVFSLAYVPRLPGTRSLVVKIPWDDPGSHDFLLRVTGQGNRRVRGTMLFCDVGRKEQPFSASIRC